MNIKIELFFDNLRTKIINFWGIILKKLKTLKGFSNMTPEEKKQLCRDILIVSNFIICIVLLFRTCGTGGYAARYSNNEKSGFTKGISGNEKSFFFYDSNGNLVQLEKGMPIPDGVVILDENGEPVSSESLLTNGYLSPSDYQKLNPNFSIDFDTSEFTTAMKEALEKQAAENQRNLEKALAEQSRQSIESQKAMDETQKALKESQKAMAELMEKQAANEEAARMAETEKREAEKALLEQRKAEEEKRKKEEEQLAKKNAKLKAEIDAINDEIRLGKTALQTGNIEEAMEHFNKAQNLMPISSGEPAFSASKKSEIAQAVFDAAEKTDNPQEKARLMKEAVSLAKSSLVNNANDPVAHNILGTDALDKKDYNTALEEFKKAVQYDPNNYLYYYNLGKTQYILKKYSEAVTSFLTSCRLNDRFSPSRYNLGLAQLKLKNETQALDAFRKAIDINPRYEKAYLEQARILAKRNDNNGAVNSYKKVIEINSVNTTALMELGSVYYADNKLSLSEESYLKALSLMQSSPNYTLTCYNLSTVLFEEQKYSDAVSYAKKAYEGKNYITDDKAKANIIYNYALMLEKNGNFDLAIKIYSEVLKYDPNHYKTKINLGVMYMTLTPPDAESALSMFKSVYAADNKNFEANNNLGNAYLLLEDYKNSVKYYQAALQIDPKNNDVRINLARAYAKDEDYSSAKTVYTELIKIDNKNWDAYIELAKVCLQLGDNTSAEKYLVYLQEKNPSFRKTEVQNLLDNL